MTDAIERRIAELQLPEPTPELDRRIDELLSAGAHRLQPHRSPATTTQRKRELPELCTAEDVFSNSVRYEKNTPAAPLPLAA